MWDRVDLPEVLEFREGPGILSKDFYDAGVPLIRLSGLKGKSIIDGCNYLAEDDVIQRWSHFRVRLGDTLLSTSASLGEVAVVDAAGIGAVPYTGIITFRPKDDRVVPEFIPLMLRESSFKAQIEAMGVGSVMKHFGPSHLRQMSVTLPPRREQQAIAEVLGALDDKIAANIALAAAAESLASLTYDAAVAAWPRVPMSEVVEPILGGTPQRAREEYWADGDQLWISARDLTSAPARVVHDTAEKISRSAVASTKAKALPAGSVVLSARGTVGEVGRLAHPASFNQSCYGFRPDVVPPSLLYFSILRATERAKAIAHGSVFDTITKATFDHLELRWDRDSAAAAEDVVAPSLGVVSQATAENRTLAATRDALLPQLMSGKLRVRDAEKIASDAGA